MKQLNFFEELKENIQNVLNDISTEKYENTFNCAYERPKKYVANNKTLKIQKL